jgi:N-succinyldiaminopimelate aminotransferase
MRAAITSRTTAILLNTPHNPTGAVLTEDELTGVARLAVEHDLLVISDEVYEHLVFDGRRHVPIATLPGMAERTLTISSAGKTFSFTGWKVGWAVGAAPLVQAVTKAKQFLTYTSGAPLQPAVAVALGLPDAFFAEVAGSLQTRRDQLCAGLTDLGLDVRVPEGTYFATTDVRALGVDDGVEFCLDLPHRAGVVAIPHSVFADDPSTGRSLVRWAFCKRPEVLDEALARLRRAYA